MNLTPRQLTSVLCALRIYQEEITNFGWDAVANRDHFQDGTEPLTLEEIDDLCESLTFGDCLNSDTALICQSLTACLPDLAHYATIGGPDAQRRFADARRALNSQPVTPQPDDSEDLPAEPESDGASYLCCTGCGAFVIEGEWTAHTH